MSSSARFSFWDGLLPFAVSVFLLAGGCFLFGDDAGNGFHQLALLSGAGVALLISRLRGGPSLGAVLGVVRGLFGAVFPTFLFLILVGFLSVSWLLAGVIPSAVFFGIKYSSGRWFLVLVPLCTGIMAFACGSSWLTVGTMGVVFLSVGEVLGFPAPLVAGAVLSGAYFGDKLTPLSETTVLAASMTDTPLMGHVRHMMWTSVVGFGLSLVLFGAAGLYYGGGDGLAEEGVAVMRLLGERFDIRGVWLLVPLFVLALIGLGVPSLWVLFAGSVVGIGIAVCFQWTFLCLLGDCSGFWGVVRVIFSSCFWGVEVADGHFVMDRLCLSGGVWGMRGTLSIIVSSLVFSGIMEGTGLLDRLVSASLGSSPSRGMLVLYASMMGVFFNITVADQYLAIILCCRIFLPLFRRAGLANVNVARVVEDAATVTSPLVPWNTCGVMQARVLGVSTLSYLPFAWFNLLSPLVSIGFGFLDIKLTRVADDKDGDEV